MTPPGPSVPDPTDEADAFVRLRTGQARFALPVAAAHRVVPLGATTRLPGTPAHVAGAMNVEGRIITVWDLGRCAGVGQVAPDDGWVLIVEHEGRRLGLLVDEVEDIQRIHDVHLVATHGDLPAAARRFVDGRLLSDSEPEPPAEPRPDSPTEADDGRALLGRLHADALGDIGLFPGLGGGAPRPAEHLGPDGPPVHLIALDRLTTKTHDPEADA